MSHPVLNAAKAGVTAVPKLASAAVKTTVIATPIMAAVAVDAAPQLAKAAVKAAP